MNGISKEGFRTELKRRIVYVTIFINLAIFLHLGCKATTPTSDPDTVVLAYQTVVIVPSSITSALVIGVAIVDVLIWKHYRLKRRYYHFNNKTKSHNNK